MDRPSSKLFTLHFLSLDCFVEGIDYYGHDISNDVQETVHGCHGACVANQECQFYTYNVETKKCYLKSSRQNKRHLDNNISGARNCYKMGNCLKLPTANPSQNQNKTALLFQSYPQGGVGLHRLPVFVCQIYLVCFFFWQFFKMRNCFFLHI